MREKLLYGLGLAAMLYLVRNLYVIFLVLPDELAQGAIYRVFYFHLPGYFTAAICYLLAGIFSAMYLITRKWKWDSLAAAITEVGLPFAAMNLITGMIWGRIIWGIWWTWDPRLTSALISALIYAGYLMLRQAIPDPTERAKNSAVMAIFAFTSVIFTYKSNEWFRTQHPGPVLSIRTGGGTIDPQMEWMLAHNLLALLLLAGLLLAIRWRQEERQREIESLRREALSFS
ncbi:MAG: cytochrome c biogenesis protein CcsA [Acidobacteria bacterium]|nr:cytochrome c biogenesis protein CcsA [Acidobacteriota bacterium]